MTILNCICCEYYCYCLERHRENVLLSIVLLIRILSAFEKNEQKADNL